MPTLTNRVRLRHKDTNAEHDFHPRTVERWKAAGWEPIPEDEQAAEVAGAAPQLDAAPVLDAPAPEPADDVDTADEAEPAPRSRAKSSATSSSTRA